MIRLPDIDSAAFCNKVQSYITTHIMPPNSMTDEECIADLAARYAAAQAASHSCLATLEDAGVDPDDIARLVAKSEQAVKDCEQCLAMEERKA